MPALRFPHLVFIFADEWRADAAGYAGDPNLSTPAIDRLAGESVDLSLAVSGCPVCCPYRASLMTGQYPLTHGVFINDVELDPHCRSLPRALSAGGYRTAYIGKWHLYGSPEGRYERRRDYVPRSHQLGFEDWWGFECSHDYWDSPWFHNDDPTRHLWEGYDLFAQSRHAADYIRQHARDSDPFALFLSWGPPHFPLHTAPLEYRRRYATRDLRLRPNVPAAHRQAALEDLRGYYAHIEAMDDGLGLLMAALEQAGIAENTLLVLTSDHGDMSFSHGLIHKLQPFDESIRVPFLLRWPAALGRSRRDLPLPLDAPDLMPTLLSLCGCDIPGEVQGRDFAPEIRGERTAGNEAALLSLPVSFTSTITYAQSPWRGLRTRRHTYVRNLEGPWLLFDNQADPYQMRNLSGRPEAAMIQADLERHLIARLAAIGDTFEPGERYLQRAGLSHYREVRLENWGKKPWSWPWGGQ